MPILFLLRGSIHIRSEIFVTICYCYKKSFVVVVVVVVFWGGEVFIHTSS